MQSQQPSGYLNSLGDPGSLDRIFFMRPVLDAISRPPFLRQVFAWGLRVVAILLVIGAAIAWLNNWRLATSLPGAAIVGGILFQALFAVAVYMVAHTVFIRAADITNLDDTDFVVIPIFSIMLRLVGEMYAIFLAVMGVAGCLVVWFAGFAARSLLGSAPLPPGISNFLFFGGGESFVAGLMLLAAAVIGAFLALVFFYMLAESLVVLVRIAHHTRVTREILERNSRI